jgi:cellulose synthase operon protein C
MSNPCDELGAFHAGELDELRAEAMRRHIGRCLVCQRELGQLILEETVTHPRGRPLVRPPRPGPSWLRYQRPRIAAIAAATALAAVVTLVYRRAGSPTRPESTAVELASVLAPVRALEMRLSAADVHRRYDVHRSKPAAREEIPHALVAELERRRDAAGLFAAELLRGDLEAAERALDSAAAGPARDSDRAALHLAAGRAEMAIGHVAAALAREPGFGPALWNGAVARRRLRLPRSAAAQFERVAALGEPGWSAEAAAEAARLRAAWTEQDQAWRRADHQATRLRLERAPMDLDLARRFPDLAAEAIHDALRAATAAQAARLVRLAEVVDSENESTALSAAVRRAGRPPSGRAVLAAEYARLLIEKEPTSAQWLGLARGAGRRMADIALGALAHSTEIDSSARAELDAAALAVTDPWLRAWVAEKVAWSLLYKERRYRTAELRLRPALALCSGRAMPVRCARLHFLLAGALLTQGRQVEAHEQLELGAVASGMAQDRKTELWRLHMATEFVTGRDPAAGDPIALGTALAEERTLADPKCEAELFNLDYLTTAALDLNRREEARRFNDRASQLMRGPCARTKPRLNSALARARLFQHQATAEELGQLRADIAAMRGKVGGGMAALLDHAEGRMMLERAPARAEYLLRRLIHAPDAAEDSSLADQARALSVAALALDAGRRGEHRAALELIAHASRQPVPSGCAIGVVGEDRVLTVVVDPGGHPSGRYRALAPGQRVLPAAELVPPELQTRLAGCQIVDVHALGRYYGVAGILPDELAWRYRSPAARSQGPARSGTRLIVTEVEPPSHIGLPALKGRPDETGAVVLRGPAATPRRVLTAATLAAEIQIHAHGWVDVDEPSAAALILSPDVDGDYVLDAARLRTLELKHRPLVILAACHAGRVQYSERPWGLADAFLRAGARAVVAGTGEVLDSASAESMSLLAARTRTGRDVAEVLRDLRVARRDQPWLNSILVFE